MGLALIYCHGQLGKMKFQTMGWNGAPLLQDQSLLHRQKGLHIISRICPLAGPSDSVQDTIPHTLPPTMQVKFAIVLLVSLGTGFRLGSTDIVLVFFSLISFVRPSPLLHFL